MTPLKVSIAASIASLLLLLIVFELIRSRRLRERYAILWLVTGVVLLVLSAWRDALNKRNVIATIEREGIDAVVVGRMLRVSPGLAEELRARFPERRRFETVTIYLR